MAYVEFQIARDALDDAIHIRSRKDTMRRAAAAKARPVAMHIYIAVKGVCANGGGGVEIYSHLSFVFVLEKYLYSTIAY